MHPTPRAHRSLGNEAGWGPVLDAAAAWLRASDPSRPVQYEVRACA